MSTTGIGYVEAKTTEKSFEAEEEAKIRRSELNLLILSPGFPFVVLWVSFCWIVQGMMPLNMRPLPGEELPIGIFVKDAEVDKPWVSKGICSMYELLVYGFTIPPIILALGCYLNPIAGDLRAAYYGFFSAMASNLTVTNLTKNYVGRFRPILYDMCGYDQAISSCTLEGPAMDNLRMSFPSGHCSIGMCSMLFLTLFFLGKIGPVGSSGRLNVVLSKDMGVLRLAPAAALAAMTPALLGFWLCVTRVHDNWHHPSDAIAGALIGSACSIFWYHLGYPPNWSATSHIPLVSPIRDQMDQDQIRAGCIDESSPLLAPKPLVGVAGVL